MARRRGPSPRQFSRTDRIGELVREVVASELERIGDERLELVTVTAVDVDGSLEHARVYYSALGAEEEGRAEEVAEALEERRWKVQQVVNRQVRARRTPQIRFEPDTVLSAALRIDEILSSLQDEGGDAASGGADPLAGDGQPPGEGRDTEVADGRRPGEGG